MNYRLDGVAPEEAIQVGAAQRSVGRFSTAQGRFGTV
jgi:hypothetical protein